jgi:hypothetical protein
MPDHCCQAHALMSSANRAVRIAQGGWSADSSRVDVRLQTRPQVGSVPS